MLPNYDDMRTDVCKSGEDELTVKGLSPWDLVEMDPIFLLHEIHGVKPGLRNLAIFRALMSASVDHGLSPPSTLAVRLAASCGAPLNQALATGINVFGQHHGPAARAADVFKHRDIEQILAMPRIPGFGHPIHKLDPRVEPLLHMFEHPSGPYVDKLQTVRRHAPVQPNLAGVTACMMLDCGWPCMMADLPFIMGRIMGMSVHWREQCFQEKLLTFEKLTNHQHE